MALWGRTDTLADSPKYITRKAYFGTSAVNTTANTINLTNSNTTFAVGDGVVYNNNGGASITGLTSGNTYYIAAGGAAGVFKLSDTEAHAKAGTDIIDISGTGNAAQFLQRNAEGNENTAEGNGDHTYNGMDLYFIDADEAQQPENRARGLKAPGWWLYRAWTNADGSLAQHSECLVAMTAYTGATGFGTFQAQTGDLGTGLRNGATDDPVVVDSTVTITAQPTNQSVVGGETATFTITASLAGPGSLTYQWQVQEGGTGSWTNVSRGTGGTTTSYTTGTTLVLGASGAATNDNNGDKYRCIVGSSTGNTDVTSNAVTLTVTA
jgi:hypothetical protein